MYNSKRSRHSYSVAAWALLLILLVTTVAHGQALRTFSFSASQEEHVGLDSIKVDLSVPGFTRALVTGNFTYRGSVPYRKPLRFEKGANWVQLTPTARANNPNAIVSGDTVIWRDAWVSTDVKQLFYNRMVKEIIEVKASSAPDTFVWKFETNLTRRQVGNQIKLGTFTEFQNPTGFDALGNALEFNVKLMQVGGNWFYGLHYRKPDSVVTLTYPLTIDPTFKFNYNDVEDSRITQDNSTSNYGYSSYIMVGGDSSKSDMSGSWIRFNISPDSITSLDSIVSAYLVLTHHVTNSDGDVDYYVHLVKVGQPVEGQITWHIWKTSNNWNTAGAKGRHDIYYTSPSPVSYTSLGERGEGLQDSIDVTTLVRYIAGVDSSLPNYGFFLRCDGSETGRAYYRSSENTTISYRPVLYITTPYAGIKQPEAPVIAISSTIDSVNFAHITSLGESLNDTSVTEYAIIYEKPTALNGRYVGTNGDSLTNPMWLHLDQWQGHLINAYIGNALVQVKTKARWLIDSTDIKTSPGSNSIHTRCIPPDSVAYTKLNDISASIDSWVWSTENDLSNNFYVTFKDLVRSDRSWISGSGFIGDSVDTDSGFTIYSSRTLFAQLVPHINNVFEVWAKNADGVLAWQDTFVVCLYEPASGGGGGSGVTISQVKNAISDSMDVARVAFPDSVRGIVNDSLLAFNNSIYPDSAEAYVMVQDTTWGGTVLRKLKTLLGRVLH